MYTIRIRSIPRVDSLRSLGVKTKLSYYIFLSSPKKKDPNITKSEVNNTTYNTHTHTQKDIEVLKILLVLGQNIFIQVRIKIHEIRTETVLIRCFFLHVLSNRFQLPS